MQTQTYCSNTQICHNTISIQRNFLLQSQTKIMCVKCTEGLALSKGKNQNLIQPMLGLVYKFIANINNDINNGLHYHMLTPQS
jgi:hypothetical protein